MSRNDVNLFNFHLINKDKVALRDKVGYVEKKEFLKMEYTIKFADIEKTFGLSRKESNILKEYYFHKGSLFKRPELYIQDENLYKFLYDSKYCVFDKLFIGTQEELNKDEKAQQTIKEWQEYDCHIETNLFKGATNNVGEEVMVIIGAY